MKNYGFLALGVMLSFSASISGQSSFQGYCENGHALNGFQRCLLKNTNFGYPLCLSVLYGLTAPTVTHTCSVYPKVTTTTTVLGATKVLTEKTQSTSLVTSIVITTFTTLITTILPVTTVADVVVKPRAFITPSVCSQKKTATLNCVQKEKINTDILDGLYLISSACNCWSTQILANYELGLTIYSAHTVTVPTTIVVVKTEKTSTTTTVDIIKVVPTTLVSTLRNTGTTTLTSTVTLTSTSTSSSSSSSSSTSSSTSSSSTKSSSTSSSTTSSSTSSSTTSSSTSSSTTSSSTSSSTTSSSTTSSSTTSSSTTSSTTSSSTSSSTSSTTSTTSTTSLTLPTDTSTCLQLVAESPTLPPANPSYSAPNGYIFDLGCGAAYSGLIINIYNFSPSFYQSCIENCSLTPTCQGISWSVVNNYECILFSGFYDYILASDWDSASLVYPFIA